MPQPSASRGGKSSLIRRNGDIPQADWKRPVRARYGRDTVRAIISLLLASTAWTLPAAQAPAIGVSPDTPTEESRFISPGRVVERIHCPSDPNLSYALYVPSSYTPDKHWPLLLVMDPRGRAPIPLELFRAAAEKHGYIIASSYDTASDGPLEPNEKALLAMLRDLPQRLALDRDRLYLTGFSGTARAAWSFAYRLSGGVTGILGFGAGLPEGLASPTADKFVFFGAAGTHDFNYEEIRRLDTELDRIGIRHQVAIFEGGHEWPPVETCDAAIDWMEIQAIRSGLRAPDSGWVTGLLSKRLQAARSLEASGDPYGAYIRFGQIAADLTGLADVSEARERAEALGRSKQVRQVLARQDRLATQQREYEQKLIHWLQRLHGADPPPDVKRSVTELRIASLKREAADPSDPLGADAAHRLLALAFAHTSFYEPRQLLESAKPARALASLGVAEAIKPGHPGVCYRTAQALAQLGRREEAMASLACAVEGGVADAEGIEADTYLTPLREEPAYRALIERLAPQSQR